MNAKPNAIDLEDGTVWVQRLGPVTASDAPMQDYEEVILLLHRRWKAAEQGAATLRAQLDAARRLLAPLFESFDAMVSPGAFRELRAEVRAFLASPPAPQSGSVGDEDGCMLGDCPNCGPMSPGYYDKDGKPFCAHQGCGRFLRAASGNEGSNG